jgi:glycosyltransferase involved in cell wall biosynthesis
MTSDQPAPASPEGDLHRLVVVVPAYNEEDSIAGTVRALRAIDERLSKLGCELRIYVVDDGSTDRTRELAWEASADRVVHHRQNRGLGAAIRSGLTAARSDHADIVVKFDADLQHDPDDIPALVKPILDDEADLVYGNRFERISYRMPLIRRVGNTVFTRLMAWLTGWPIKDSQPGIFAAHRSYLERFYIPGAYNYTQQILLDAYHKGARFAHVPVAFRERNAGTSFVSLKYPFRVVPQILVMLATLRPLRVFVPLGVTFVLLGAGVLGWDLTQWLLGNSSRPVQSPNAVIGFGLFGIQTVFFGLLGHLIIQQSRS